MRASTTASIPLQVFSCVQCAPTSCKNRDTKNLPVRQRLRLRLTCRASSYCIPSAPSCRVTCKKNTKNSWHRAIVPASNLQRSTKFKALPFAAFQPACLCSRTSVRHKSQQTPFGNIMKKPEAGSKPFLTYSKTTTWRFTTEFYQEHKLSVSRKLLLIPIGTYTIL